MKLLISPDSVCSFARLALVARVICGVVIDMPDLLNAGWLAILLGGLLALIPAWAVLCIRTHEGFRTPRPIRAVFFVIAVYDASVISAAIADSAGCMALNSTASAYLMLPHLLLSLVCLRLNGDALCSSAGIWNRVLPCLLLIVFFLQAGDYRPEWLTPVLGPGVQAITNGALRIAGWFTLPTALYLACGHDAGGQRAQLRPIRTLMLCSVFAALIALSFSMMTPAITNEKLFGRAFRLDALLANGRAGLGIQMPTIALWYVGLFYALMFDLFTADVMLQTLLPGRTRGGCILLSVIIAGIVGTSRLSSRSSALAAAGWLYAAQCVLLASAILTALSQKGGVRHA